MATKVSPRRFDAGTPGRCSRRRRCGWQVRGVRHLLDAPSLWVAGVAGLGIALPSVDYLAALAVILASGATLATQVGGLVMFNVVAFTFVEIPLLAYLAAPAKTRRSVAAVQDWIRSGHRRAALLAAVGCVLLAVGIAGLLRRWSAEGGAPQRKRMRWELHRARVELEVRRQPVDRTCQASHRNLQYRCDWKTIVCPGIVLSALRLPVCRSDEHQVTRATEDRTMKRLLAGATRDGGGSLRLTPKVSAWRIGPDRRSPR